MDGRRTSSGGRRLSKWVGIAAFSGILAAAAVGVSHGKLRGEPEDPARRARPLAVAAEIVRHDPGYVRRRAFVGRIEASRKSDVGFELDGKVEILLVDEGDAIRRGQTLARLDVARLRARRSELEAALIEIRARRKLAEITRNRTQGLVGEGAASQQKLDDDRETVRALRGAEQLAEARLASNALEIEKSELVAPYDGVVIRRFVDEGRVLGSGTPVLRLMETSTLEARIGVAGSAVEQLREGQAHFLRIDDVGTRGRIKAILPLRGARDRTVDVVFTLEDDQRSARAGDLVRLTLEETLAARGFWLSIDALTEGPRGLWAVSVVEPVTSVADSPNAATHAVERRLVEILHAEGKRAFVRGDVAEGDRYVERGLHRVVPGQPVRLATPEDRS